MAKIYQIFEEDILTEICKAIHSVVGTVTNSKSWTEAVKVIFHHKESEPPLTQELQKID